MNAFLREVVKMENKEFLKELRKLPIIKKLDAYTLAFPVQLSATLKYGNYMWFRSRATIWRLTISELKPSDAKGYISDEITPSNAFQVEGYKKDLETGMASEELLAIIRNCLKIYEEIIEIREGKKRVMRNRRYWASVSDWFHGRDRFEQTQP